MMTSTFIASTLSGTDYSFAIKFGMGSFADLDALEREVRFTAMNGHRRLDPLRPLRARCGNSRMLKHSAVFFAIVKDIRGRSAEEHRLIRQQRSRPLAGACPEVACAQSLA
jgi:hypothetical protein